MLAAADNLKVWPRFSIGRWRKFVALPPDEQDAIASEILASLADEEAWKRRFAEKRPVIRRMAREAIEEDESGETLPLDDLL